MSKEDEKRFDDLFKKQLYDPAEKQAYREDDWDAMEQMLDDRKKKRGVIYLFAVLGSVAALLLLFFGWWLFNKKTTGNPVKNDPQMVVRQRVKDSVGRNLSGVVPSAKKQTTRSTATYAANSKTKPSGNATRVLVASVDFLHKRHSLAGDSTTLMQNRQQLLSVKSMSPSFGDNEVFAGRETISAADLHDPYPSAPPAKTQPDANRVKLKARSTIYRPQLAVSVLAAPDINGVGSSFQQGKVGTNFGLMFAVGLSKKLTISAGALYSNKPYNTNFNNYHTAYKFQQDPSNVYAECRMIDIPLNIGYQVYHKHQDKISVGTGLSSYLMLHENYKFTYEYGNNAGPANYVVPNSKSYFLGVVNLNATYERQVNSKFGIAVQPYIKLPLTDVGYSQVKLQSTGVAIGLTYNLNTLSKP